MSGEPADPGARGADLAREALARARAARPGAAATPTRRRRKAGDRAKAPDAWTAAGPDEWDPQAVGTVIGDLVSDNGWQRTSKVATVLARWPEIVGAQIADHCRPEQVDDGVLVLAAESTAWATQLRLLEATMLARIADQLGPGLVTGVRVHGPTAPDWRHGPRRIVGRGPRDTYG